MTAHRGPTTRPSAAVRLVVAAGAHGVLLALLVALGRVDGFATDVTDIAAWTGGAPGEELAATTARLLALAVTGWSLLSVLVGALGTVPRTAPVARRLRRFTLAPARRFAEGVAVASIGTMAIAGPVTSAVAADVRPAAAVAVADDELVVRAPSPPVATSDPGDRSRDEPGAPGDEPRDEARDELRDEAGEAPGGAPARHHTIERGEHLWSVASHTLATALERTPTDAEIGAYWVSLVEMNRDGLRSGNPNLVHPGEVLELPPVPDRFDT